jgi:hypothetical protein
MITLDHTTQFIKSHIQKEDIPIHIFVHRHQFK